MAITLTQSAAARVGKLLADRGKGVGLRIGIKPAGCSGYTHSMDFVDEIGPNDQVFEEQGITIVVDADSLPHLQGTVLDYVKEGLNAAFKFHNPNAKDSCGCGSSFSV